MKKIKIGGIDMTVFESERDTVIFLQMLAETKNKNVVISIYEDDLIPLLETEHICTAPYSLIRNLLTQLKVLIEGFEQVSTINEFSKNIIQVMMFIDIDWGIQIPKNVDVLVHELEVLHYFYRYGDFVFHTDITRDIDALLPVPTGKRLLFASILNKPH